MPRLFGRAIVAKCPWCGSRRTFLAGWFKRYDRCRTCGVSWHREEGFELGTITINTIVTFASIAIAMGVGFAVWGTDVPLVTFMAIVGAIAVLMPIAIYPLTYTIWLAFDLAVKPPDRAELDEMMAAVAALSADEIETVKKALTVREGQVVKSAVEQARMASVRACPHCGSVRFVKDGHANGRQRFRCRETGCARTFNALTGTPLARLHMPEKHLENARLMAAGLSVRVTAERLGVSDSWDFAFALMRSARVAVTPGRDFGNAATSRFVRFSTASSMEHLQCAADRLHAVLA